MARSRAPAGYTGMQIALHWIIAGLVIFQVIFGEEIKPAYRAARRAAEASAQDAFNANIHVFVGIAILLLALWRLFLRLRHGIPMLPENENVMLRWIAIVTHGVLYFIIFAMPVSGMVAWFGGINAAGEVHELGKPVIIIFVALHTAGALWQHFIARNDVLVRMLKPEQTGN
jgi:cytochrome b561